MLLVNLRYDNDFGSMDPDVWSQFREIWPGAKELQQKNFFYYSTDIQRLTEDECIRLQNLGVTIEIKGVDGTMLTKMKDHPGKKWKYGDMVTPEDLLNGAAVQITLPDVGLLLVDEVTWREDECTEEIQRMLDDGWRIIAVCPPNAQRRPDYILGRRRGRSL